MPPASAPTRVAARPARSPALARLAGAALRVLVGLGVIAVAAAGCGDGPAAGPGRRSPAAGACGPVQHPPVQAGGHLLGEREPPEPYSSTPPTSGWHAAGAVAARVYGDDEALSEPEQVTVLESGGVVVTHRGLEAAQRAALESLATEQHPGRVAVTPYDGLAPGEVAVAAWGRLQVCDGVELDVVRAFIDAHAGRDADAH